MNSFRVTLLLSLGAVGCAPDLRTEFPFDGETKDGPLIVVTVGDNNSRVGSVDATSKSAWVYFDLDHDKELKVEEALATNAWDLQLQRFTIKSNGGSGNPSGVVKVAVLKDINFDSLGTAPSSGYVQDGDTPAFNGPEGGWYIYDITKHGVNPNTALTYVVESSEQKFYKLRITNYYDAAGTAATLTIDYAPITAPAVLP